MSCIGFRIDYVGWDICLVCYLVTQKPKQIHLLTESRGTYRYFYTPIYIHRVWSLSRQILVVPVVCTLDFGYFYVQLCAATSTSSQGAEVIVFLCIHNSFQLISRQKIIIISCSVSINVCFISLSSWCFVINISIVIYSILYYMYDHV